MLTAARVSPRQTLRQSAVQEQKRRDFDRVLGAGTDGQSNY